MRYKRQQKQIFNIETTQVNSPAFFVQQDTKLKGYTPSEAIRQKAATKEKNYVLFMKALQSAFQKRLFHLISNCRSNKDRLDDLYNKSLISKRLPKGLIQNTEDGINVNSSVIEGYLRYKSLKIEMKTEMKTVEYRRDFEKENFITSFNKRKNPPKQK